jgi:CRISPR-associated endonuclease/helicase Cas3
LLEAGVDLDFPVGYRTLAGLESIVQAAGRVNREKRQPVGTLYIFEAQSEAAGRAPEYIRQAAGVARLILNRYPDPVSAAAIHEYFVELSRLQAANAADMKNILGCFDKGTCQPDFDFQTAAERFKLIENDTVGVIIPYTAEAEQWIAELRGSEFPFSLVRKLQPYTVNIFEPEFNALLSQGAVEVIDERFPVLNNRDLYQPLTGLAIPETARGQAIFS